MRCARATGRCWNRSPPHDDLVDVLAETNAELNTSHTYVTPTGGHGDAKVAWLGADLGRNEKGEVVINRILDGESSDPKARSRCARRVWPPGQGT